MSTAAQQKQGPSGRRRRPRRRKKAEAPLPTRVVAAVTRAEQTPSQEKPVEAPLTAAELSEMAAHFRFLKEHRKVLNLRVNAHEDLLLNGSRAPTRRGVCQHLLAKVDRARVFSAAERLDAAAATRLIAGVLRISPDLDYLLLYLDCVRRSGNQEQSVAALSEALARIDFEAVSPAQMRRVLDLIVDNFDETQRAWVLLSSFDNPAFLRSVDNATDRLPEALANLTGPLLQVQQVVVRGRPQRTDHDALEKGLILLVSGSGSSSYKLSVPMRRRLLRLAAQSPALVERTTDEVLFSLWESVTGDAETDLELGLGLARAWFSAQKWPAARRLLERLSKLAPANRAVNRLLAALDAPRVSMLALLPEHPKRRGGSNKPSRGLPGDAPRSEGIDTRSRLVGLCLESLRSVTVLLLDAERGEGAPPERLPLLCGVAPVLHRGSLSDGRRFVAVPRIGRPLSHALDVKGGLRRDVALGVCAEAVAILSTLKQVGLGLPDARPSRFELDPESRLWLTDLRGLESGVEAPAAQAARLCRDVLGAARGYLAPTALRNLLANEPGWDELVGALAHYVADHSD